MTDNSFKKVGDSENRLYGPRKILLCGYPESEQYQFRTLLQDIPVNDIILIAANTESLSQTLDEIFSNNHSDIYAEKSEMQRATILAGITEKELHAIINAYRKSGLPGQFWATLTPVSKNWTLQALLEELKKENEAIRKRRQSV